MRAACHDYRSFKTDSCNMKKERWYYLQNWGKSFSSISIALKLSLVFLIAIVIPFIVNIFCRVTPSAFGKKNSDENY